MRNIFKFFISVLIFLGIIFGLFYYFFLRNNCQLPRTYSLGQLDSRFKISSSDVLITAQDAAGRWNEETGENLLKYDTNSKLKVNLIYDQRQADLDKINAEINNLTNQRQSVETTNEQFKTLLADYQAKLASYNQQVSYWNSHGGAPPAVFAQLQQEKSDLDQQRNELTSMAQILNLEATNFNENLDSLKNELDSRKNLIVTQGIYDPATDTINIYTFGTSDELRLVLMHELGHSLGLGHDGQPTSIMYQLLDQQDLKNPLLSTEDINLLKAHCNLDYTLSGALRRIRLAI